MILWNRLGEQADNPVPCSKRCSWKKGLKIKEKRMEMEQMNSNFYISQKIIILIEIAHVHVCITRV